VCHDRVVLFCNLTYYYQRLKAVQMNFMYNTEVYIRMGIPVSDLEIPREWGQTLHTLGTNLVHHAPATSSARSATGCVVHGLSFLPTTSPTRDDETRCVNGSVHDFGNNNKKGIA